MAPLAAAVDVAALATDDIDDDTDGIAATAIGGTTDEDDGDTSDE